MESDCTLSVREVEIDSELRQGILRVYDRATLASHTDHTLGINLEAKTDRGVGQ